VPERWQYAEAGISKLQLIKPLLILLNVLNFKIPTSPGLRILRVDLNPPSRIAFLKVPDSFYTRKLLTTKISNYEKEIGFYYCRAGYHACS
jgi:hypothetical protein